MSYTGFILPPLIRATLIRRYKRFLADVTLENGETITVHCPNSGSMRGCADPGSIVWLSLSDNQQRKYPYTWELLELEQTMVGINTMVPNKLVRAAIEENSIRELGGYDRIQSEVKTSDHTRLDLVLEARQKKSCYVEIKNCTLVENGVAMFPDAVTIRGQKHLEELSDLVADGHRGVIFFLIQRSDARVFKPAAMIDAVYAQRLRQAADAGVEIVTRDTQIDTRRIALGRSVPVQLER